MEKKEIIRKIKLLEENLKKCILEINHAQEAIEIANKEIAYYVGEINKCYFKISQIKSEAEKLQEMLDNDIP